MNVRQAQQKGYHFHGAYSNDKEEMKQRAAELRTQGNKAVVADTPSSSLSRGFHGMGYSVYWIESEENIQKRKQAQTERKREGLIAEREKITERLAEIDVLLSITCEVCKKEITNDQASTFTKTGIAHQVCK